MTSGVPAPAFEGPEPPAAVSAQATGPAAAPEVPEIPEAVREAARHAPGHWIGMVDPEWSEKGAPPEWTVLGEWQSDDHGDVGTFRPNPEYRPSARALGWPEPTDPVDVAAQRAATGYGTVEEALDALAEAEVTVLRGPDGEPVTATGRDGSPVVLMFTSPLHQLMSDELLHDTRSALDLARSLRGSGALLMVNPGAAAPLFVPADSLPDPASGTDDHPPGADRFDPSAVVALTTTTDDPDASTLLRTTGRTP